MSPPAEKPPWPPSAATRWASSGDAGWRWTSRPAAAGIRAAGGAGLPARRAHDRRQIERSRASTARRREQPAPLSDDLADRRRAHGRELAPEILGEGFGEPLDLLGRARELRPEVLALGRDAGRAGVEVALASHVAAERHEHRRPERELLGAEERGDEQVAARPQAAVGAERDPIAEAVPEQRLVDLGEAQLPRRADVLDRGQRRCARPARVSRQLDVVRAGLDDARGDRPDAARRDELDADPGRRVDRPQVGDELGEILDRVDVVVRRRADVRHPRLAAAEGRDVRRRLPSGELAAFARLRALGDLDLELVGAGEVRGGDAEPGGRDLLDLRVVALAGRRRGVPGRILAAFAGVRRAAGALDADRQRLVGLRREGADRHRRHDEAADDVAGRLDVGEGDGGGRCGSMANSEAVADDRARAGGREGVAVAGEDGVDVGRVAFGAQDA